MLNESRNNNIRSNMKRYCSCRERQGSGSMLLHLAIGLTLIAQAYHSKHTAWFLDAECLHHLEHIHNALYLAAFSGIDESTEHPTPTHCITTGDDFVCMCIYVHVFMCVWMCICACSFFKFLQQQEMHTVVNANTRVYPTINKHLYNEHSNMD